MAGYRRPTGDGDIPFGWGTPSAQRAAGLLDIAWPPRAVRLPRPQLPPVAREHPSAAILRLFTDEAGEDWARRPGPPGRLRRRSDVFWKKADSRMLFISLLGLMALCMPLVGASLAGVESRWSLLVGLARAPREAVRFWPIALFGVGVLTLSWAASGGTGMWEL